MIRLLVGCVAVTACTGATSDPGLDAWLRVANAQFVSGDLPTPSTDIRVTAIDSLNNTIRAGQIDKGLSGRVENRAEAVALGFPGDAGYWIVPAGAADLNLPDELTWAAKVSFAATLAPGPHDLAVVAVDANGELGAPTTLTLTVQSRELDLTDSKLAVSLTWDTEADLDVHLDVPATPPVTVWWGHPSSYVVPAPGDPVDPDAIAASGILDTDSNDQCVIDGRREENIVWRGATAMPPHGTYAVRVDTFSLCAAATAHWTVDVFVGADPTSIAHAEGTVVDSDTRGAHDAAAGVRALTFDY